MHETVPWFLKVGRLRPDAPLFVLLPGMDGTGELLSRQATKLNVRFDTRCLTIPPGHLGDWSVLTEQVIGLIHRELSHGPKRAVYLCGESFGGCLAIKMALHSPHLFSRMILINPASSFRQTGWIGLGSLVTWCLPEAVYRFSSAGLLLWLANLQRIAAGDRQALWQAIQALPQRTSGHRMAMLNNFWVSAAGLRQLAQPILLIASAADHLLPSVKEAHWLAQHLPDSRMVVLPYSGHACLLETDIDLYEILKEQQFLPEYPVESQ